MLLLHRLIDKLGRGHCLAKCSVLGSAVWTLCSASCGARSALSVPNARAGGGVPAGAGGGTSSSASSAGGGSAAIHELAAGLEHTCARKQDGTLWCWGHNDVGELGDGTLVNTSAPVQVAALGASAVEVSAGGLHTCARKQDGTLWCWGHNDVGELGDGTVYDEQLLPVQAKF